MPPRRHNPRPLARPGFTLIELLCTVAIVGILGSAMASIIQQAARTSNQANTRAQLAAEGSGAMDRIINRLAQISTRPSTTPPQADIDAMTATSLSFDAGSLLQLTGTNLILRDVEAGDALASTPILLRNVSALTLEARDASNALLAEPVNLTLPRQLVVTITLTRAGTSTTLRGRAFLRGCSEYAAP